MAYSPAAHTTATSGRVGFVRLGSGVSGNSDGSIVSNATLLGLTASSVGLGNVTNESKATMFTNPTFTGTVGGVTKTHVGLGNVDNTADANKSVNYASSAGSAPASDVYAWAKASTKPSYTASEVGLSNVGNYTVNQNLGTGNDVTHNSVTAGAFYYSSDATLKTNIDNLTNYWEILDKLRPVSFDWISNGKKDLGLLAQDVQVVLPESVKVTDDGTLAISSSGIVAHLVAAVKDLKSQVDELTKQLKG